MKRFLLSLVIATSLALTSCQFDDSDIWSKLGEVEESIRDHEQRISALEELCKQMNTNIEALQTLVDALEKRDYVTNVSEVRSNGEVIGYTISFAYSDDITIYHGQNGKDGTNGTDGYTPQIGVMQDADGIYYWTLDGEWLLDDNGNKIKANATDGKDGQDGTNGSNGSNGTDGITPLLKIENDYWFVSYDNGVTWEKLGKATGEDGIDGENGKNGDSIFKSVTEDEENVYFTLADGTVITLPKGDKKTAVDDVCSLMEDITFMKYCYDNFDANKDGMLSQTEAASVYTIDISGLDIYSLAGIEMFTRLEVLVAKNCTKLREVFIPNTISSIGDEAFYGCSSLNSVTIPNSITSIGSSAFYGCSSLTATVIPDGVTSIKSSTFYNCRNLTSIAIPESVTSIGSSAFCGCSSLASIAIPESVTSIGSDAFYNCKSLTSATIPDGVTTIGNSAFYNCSSLASIAIPESVISIGSSAFYGCTGELIINSKTIVEKDYTSSNYPTYGTSYGSSNWLYGNKFTKLSIGENITKIGNYAFYYWSSLTSVTIPNSVTSIGASAFYNCTSLTNITIPDSVTSIGKSAFAYCESLTNVDISDLSDWCKIDFGSSSANPLCNGAKLYLNGSELTNMTIPSDITEIKQYAFYGCTSLTSVTIPNSVTSIGNNTFSGCTSLQAVYISDLSAWCKIDFSSYTSNPLYYAKSLYLNEELFTTLTIPSDITEVQSYAFYNCESLTSVTIPDSVTKIGDYAFYECTSLTSVYCRPTTPPAGGSNMFYNSDSTLKIYVPATSLYLYKAAAYWKNYTPYIGYDFENGTVIPDIPNTYTIIENVADITAGNYYVAGKLATYTSGSSSYDWTNFPYHFWTGAVSAPGYASSNSDLLTVNGNESMVLDPNMSSPDAAKGNPGVITLVPVEGKTNTYYVKVGEQYLYCAVASTNRRMQLGDTPTEWVFADHSKGGIDLTSNGVHLATAGASYNLIRSYKDSSAGSSHQHGLVFFKIN